MVRNMRKVRIPENMTLTDRSKVLGGFASCDVRVARAWLEGASASVAIEERLQAAAAELGFEQGAKPGERAA
jgi:hypothetical protein